jgi:MraZ protein
LASFKGRFTYSIDNKGRIALPAKLRKSIEADSEDRLTITRGFEQCIYLFPQNEWSIVEQSLRNLNQASLKSRFLTREMMQWASDVELDSQSRLMIPQELLKHASIDGEVLILGVLSRIEIWNPKYYEEFENNQPETYETVAEQILQLKQ